jgi:hypothetical protein
LNQPTRQIEKTLGEDFPERVRPKEAFQVELDDRDFTLEEITLSLGPLIAKLPGGGVRWMRNVIFLSWLNLFTAFLFSSPPPCTEVLKALSVASNQGEAVVANFTAQLLERRGKVQELRSAPIGGFNDRRIEHVTVLGLPAEARALTPKEKAEITFRHYIRGKDYFEQSRSSGVVVSAAVPYVQVHPGLERKIFEDITGIFLTLPNTSEREVGLSPEPDSHYLDLKVPENIPVIELEKKRIYVIPLPRRYQEWIQKYYAQYRQGLALSTDDLKMCQDIERREKDRDISKTLGIKLNIIGGN